MAANSNNQHQHHPYWRFEKYFSLDSRDTNHPSCRAQPHLTPEAVCSSTTQASTSSATTTTTTNTKAEFHLYQWQIARLTCFIAQQYNGDYQAFHDTADLLRDVQPVVTQVLFPLKSGLKWTKGELAVLMHGVLAFCDVDHDGGDGVVGLGNPDVVLAMADLFGKGDGFYWPDPGTFDPTIAWGSAAAAAAAGRQGQRGGNLAEAEARDVIAAMPMSTMSSLPRQTHAPPELINTYPDLLRRKEDNSSRVLGSSHTSSTPPSGLSATSLRQQSPETPTSSAVDHGQRRQVTERRRPPRKSARPWPQTEQ